MFHVKQFKKGLKNASPPKTVTTSGSLYIQQGLPNCEGTEIQGRAESLKREYNRIRQQIRREKEKSERAYAVIAQTAGFSSHHVTKGFYINDNFDLWLNSAKRWGYIERALGYFLTCNEAGVWAILLRLVSGIPEARRASLPFAYHAARLWTREQKENGSLMGNGSVPNVRFRYQFVIQPSTRGNGESGKRSLSQESLGANTES